jgi:hypothetical protein
LRFTFATADSSGSSALVRTDVKMVSLIRCLTTVYRVVFIKSNWVFTLHHRINPFRSR